MYLTVISPWSVSFTKLISIYLHDIKISTVTLIQFRYLCNEKWEKLFFENFKTLWDKDKNIIWIIEEVSCRTGSLKSLTCDQAGFFTAVTCINRFNSFDCRCPQEKFLTINVKLNQVCLKCFLPLKGPHGNNRWLCFRVYRKVRGACKTYSKKKGKNSCIF